MSPLTRIALFVTLTSACACHDAPGVPARSLNASLSSAAFEARMPFELAALDIEPLRALYAAHQPKVAFWRDDAAAEADRILGILDAEQAARTAVLAAFGPEAVDLPIFVPLFRPLNDRVPDLTAEQQMHISDLERRFAATRLADTAPAGFQDLLDEIRSELGESVAGEYALRASPLAAELRAAGLDLEETAFREVFAAAGALVSVDDAASFVATRSALREQLGTSRFVRFWSRRDPAFASLRETAERQALAEDTLMSAYALMLDNQDAMIAAVASHGTDVASADRQRALRGLYDEMRRRLVEITGARTADALLLAFTGTSNSQADATGQPQF